MNRKNIISKLNTAQKITSVKNIVIKLLVLFVVITALITTFLKTPASDSFFTDRIESEPYSVEF